MALTERADGSDRTIYTTLKPFNNSPVKLGVYCMLKHTMKQTLLNDRLARPAINV